MNDESIISIPEAIDLGTVVNGKTIRWASFNLGASKAYEYGDYYAWGETAPYYNSLDSLGPYYMLNPLAWKMGKERGYSWESYALSNGSFRKLTKYCQKGKDGSFFWDATAKPEGPDGEMTLLPSDDVAYVRLGGKWRMPTLDEIKALLALKDKAASTYSDYLWEDWAIAKDANGNEAKDAWGRVIHGLRITRISTGASLFLPAAGYWTGIDINQVGSHGYYWSSSLDTHYPRFSANSAWRMRFYSGDVNCDIHIRCMGYSIRPVSE